MPRSKKPTSKAKTSKKKKPPRFVKGTNTGRKIDRTQIKKGKFIPKEASYVPPFRMASHFVVDNKGWQLVHAQIHKVPNKWKVLSKVEITPHAWVEKYGMVFDPLFEIYMPKKQFYSLFKVKGVKRYTFPQMRKMLDKKRRYGRWEEVLMFESH